MSPSSPTRYLRWPTVAALLVAAVAHVPVIPEHLREAPYMGVLFVAFTVAALALGVVLAARAPKPAAYAVAGTLCALAIAAYCLTRLVALPQLADDVGNWAEPAGVVSIVSEAVAVALSAAALRSAGLWRRVGATQRLRAVHRGIGTGDEVFG